jgi:capsular exopolysaccharide synthesis family protein
VEFGQIVSAVWRRRWIVILVVLLAAGASTAFALSRPAIYESTATLAVLPDLSREQGGFLSFEGVASLVETYAEAAESPRNLRRAERLLGRSIEGDVSATVESDTGILRIYGRDPSPAIAATAAEAVALAFQRSISGVQPLEVTLLDAATEPTEPVQPRPPLIIAVGTVLGIGLAVVAGLAIERVRRRVETDDDLAELTETPVVGRLPTARRLNRTGRWLAWEMDELVVLQEAFRALRTNLEFVAGSSLRSLQVSSALPSEGKSTVVANLAIAFAKTGVETLIVDADLRRPTQHEIFGLDNTEGLSSMLALRDRDVEPQASRYPLLSVLTSGPLPPNSTEILHIRFAAVMERLRAHKALLIVDSPPILPVSDARLLAPHMDGLLLVVSAGQRKPTEVAAALGQLELSSSSDLLGVVLNRASEDPAGRGGYYGTYEPRRSADGEENDPGKEAGSDGRDGRGGRPVAWEENDPGKEAGSEAASTRA